MINNIENLRHDFPILQQQVHGKPLAYLDTAATAQKPLAVIEAIKNFYLNDNANVHRAVHTLSERATAAFEKARLKIKNFINAKEKHEIIFVRGTTEAINLVAQSYGRSQFKTDDEIIISTMEHHANIVPWQMICQQTGAKLKVIPITETGELLLDEYEKLLNPKTKLVAITHLSNSLGTINPIKKIIELAHQQNVPVLIDGAQAVAHLTVDVQTLDCDFYAFSSHKMFGPTGIGVLYGKTALLEAMPPYQGGGDMIAQVSFAKTTYRELPHKFEAGTPNIADVIGFGAAIDYLNNIDRTALQHYEDELLTYATNKISEIPGIKLIGTAKHKASVLSFLFNDIHAHDVATILDHAGVAVRAGHHCTMPLMDYFNVPATIRASMAFYNNKADIDALINGLYHVREIFN